MRFLGGITGTNELTAKTRANQSTLNKAISWGRKYNQVVDAINLAEDAGDERKARLLRRKEEEIYDRYVNYLEELPKYEQRKVEKLIFG
jgi:hypothetical protein